MDTLSANDLNFFFGIFLVFMVLFVLFLRKISVDDLMTPPPAQKKPIIQQKSASLAPKPEISVPAARANYPPKPEKNLTTSSSGWTRAKVNSVAKIAVFIGVILIFAPLPDFFSTIGTGLAFLGYLVARASAPPKSKPTLQKK